MNEKGIMTKVCEKIKIIILKYEKRQYMTTFDSQEWGFLIECILAIEKAFSPYVIFKGKVHKAFWMKALQSGHIVLSNNSWTNELGLVWLKNYFEPEILIMIIVNGGLKF